MNKPYEQSLRSNPAGLATGSILAMIVAMGISTSAPPTHRQSPNTGAALPGC
jgi:hypothetical protein